MNPEVQRAPAGRSKPPVERNGERGVALIVVVLAVAVVFVLVLALLLQTSTERLVAMNEHDHVKALGFAEAGLTWAERRVVDGTDIGYTELLDGPDAAGATDDHLLGLRDLSLTSSAQFSNANEDTASAIVQRDFFGDGDRTYELLRLTDDAATRAHVYVRVDDNYDDDPTDPANDDPLTDTDGRVRILAVAEYPIFVDGTGTELPAGGPRRGPARRVLKATVARTSLKMAAVSSNWDIMIHALTEVCGDCGNVHTNEDLNLSGDACGDASAAGNLTGMGSAASQTAGAPSRSLPIVNPYDDLFVPTPAVFDTTGQTVSCGAPTAADPGNAKYFALVANGDKGLVYKGYYDFTNQRWAWRLIADLDDGVPDEQLDACGRTNDDPNVGALIDDGATDEFYGWKMFGALQDADCQGNGCSGDASLCDLANNDFTLNGYYEATAANDGQNATDVETQSGSGFGYDAAFPGAGAGDGVLDWYPDERMRQGEWRYESDTKWDPMWNAVIFAFGSVSISGDPGSNVAEKLWPLSVIAYGDIQTSGTTNIGPANPGADYPFLFIAGRDIELGGDFNADHTACSGSCPSTPPADIADLGGVIAAHEQVDIPGDANVFGFVYAEDAIACSIVGPADMAVKTNAGASIHYDCENPANPWSSNSPPVVQAWHEIE